MRHWIGCLVPVLAGLIACGGGAEDTTNVVQGSNLGAQGDLEPVTGDGHIVVSARALSDFVGVSNESSLSVQIEQGPELAVEVAIDSNLVDHVQTVVRNHTLVVSMDSVASYSTEAEAPQVRITLPDLQRLAVLGSGPIRAAGESDGPVSAVVSGSGKLSLDVATPELSVSATGSGSSVLSGEAEQLAINVTGSGAVDASALIARAGKVVSSGSGSVHAHYTEAVSVWLTGSGGIRVSGGAKVTERSTTGSGALSLLLSE